jgi:hypothetical protein
MRSVNASAIYCTTCAAMINDLELSHLASDAEADALKLKSCKLKKVEPAPNEQAMVAAIRKYEGLYNEALKHAAAGGLTLKMMVNTTNVSMDSNSTYPRCSVDILKRL